jgi:hypothetical protein
MKLSSGQPQPNPTMQLAPLASTHFYAHRYNDGFYTQRRRHFSARKEENKPKEREKIAATHEDDRRLALELAERCLKLGLEFLIADRIGCHGHLPQKLL